MNKKSLMAIMASSVFAAASGYDSAFGAPAEVRRRRVSESSPRKPREMSQREKQQFLSSMQLYTFNINGVEIQAHSKKDAKKIYNLKYKK